MEIQKEIELFEEILLANPDFDEALLSKDENNDYEDSSIADQLGFFQSGIEVAEREARMGAKAQAVPEKDAIIKKLSDQLYSQEMKTSAARTLCETACELLDDYAHQDAMVILNDLEQAMIETQEQKG